MMCHIWHNNIIVSIQRIEILCTVNQIDAKIIFYYMKRTEGRNMHFSILIIVYNWITNLINN